MNINIKKFNEFILENNTSNIFPMYILVDRIYKSSASNALGVMTQDVRKELFEQIIITEKNFKKINLKENVPIINFTEKNDIVKKMIDTKLIDINSLYNHPDMSELVSDKIKFHKAFDSKDFVPKTLFTKEKALTNLKFPVIAKPSKGHSAEGIQKFNNKEDLKKSNHEFDIFSEMIEIKKEFRCFCFRDKIIELNERKKIDKEEDFLEKSSSKTNFFYKKISHDSYHKKTRLIDILKQCKNIANLDFFSLDFAEDIHGNLFVIEMNSRTGMGADKTIKLYKFIYEDYYKKTVSKDNNLYMNSLIKDWKNTYDKQKKINECTTVVGNVNNVNFLFKNRDRSYTPDIRIIHEKFNNVEIAYYVDQTGWLEGMNEYGVGCVFSNMTHIKWKGYEPSYYVTDEPKNDSASEKFHSNVLNMLTSKNVEIAISKIIKGKKDGNYLMSDKNSSYELEIHNGEYRIKKLVFSDNSFYTKTNHGVLFPEAGHQPSGESIKRASSQIRKHQADIQLAGIKDISEIPMRMKFQAFDSESSLNVFRTDSEEYTISQCLFDLTNLNFYFYHDKATADTLKIEDNIKDGKIKITAIHL